MPQLLFQSFKDRLTSFEPWRNLVLHSCRVSIRTRAHVHGTLQQHDLGNLGGIFGLGMIEDDIGLAFGLL